MPPERRGWAAVAAPRPEVAPVTAISVPLRTPGGQVRGPVGSARRTAYPMREYPSSTERSRAVSTARDPASSSFMRPGPGRRGPLRLGPPNALVYIGRRRAQSQMPWTRISAETRWVIGGAGRR